MALPSSGQITLDQMHVEVGGTSGTQASINDSDIRSMIGASSGQANLSFSDFYGASSSVTINITISSNTNNYNLWNSKGGTYSAGNTTINVTINSGVTIGSTSSGTYAFTTGLGWVTGDVINITNNGTIKGKGGNGGAGGNAVYGSVPAGSGSNGVTGGPAFRGQFACTVTNNGSVYGGGGGGGGGGSFWSVGIKANLEQANGGGGGGGGAGVTSSSGGAGGTASGANPTNTAGGAGSAGGATAGGAGGASSPGGPGGAGGGLGANGSAGTAAAATVFQPASSSSGGSGGVRGYYQVGSSLINGGSGLSGTVGGRSA